VTRAEQIRRLSELSQAVLDRRLAELRSARAARQATADALAGLTAAEPATDLAPAAAERVRQQYEAWADLRRRTLIPLLARQSAAALDAEAAARSAFGRCSVLDALGKRKGQPS
jgi:predicted Abi (CAAX) family protease